MKASSQTGHSVDPSRSPDAVVSDLAGLEVHWWVLLAWLIHDGENIIVKVGSCAVGGITSTRT